MSWYYLCCWVGGWILMGTAETACLVRPCADVGALCIAMRGLRNIVGTQQLLCITVRHRSDEFGRSASASPSSTRLCPWTADVANVTLLPLDLVTVTVAVTGVPSCGGPSTFGGGQGVQLQVIILNNTAAHQRQPLAWSLWCFWDDIPCETAYPSMGIMYSHIPKPGKELSTQCPAPVCSHTLRAHVTLTRAGARNLRVCDRYTTPGKVDPISAGKSDATRIPGRGRPGKPVLRT